MENQEFETAADRLQEFESARQASTTRISSHPAEYLGLGLLWSLPTFFFAAGLIWLIAAIAVTILGTALWIHLIKRFRGYSWSYPAVPSARVAKTSRLMLAALVLPFLTVGAWDVFDWPGLTVVAITAGIVSTVGVWLTGIRLDRMRVADSTAPITGMTARP